MAGISLGDLKAFKSYAKLIHSKMQATTRTSKTSDGIVAEKDQLLDSRWAIFTLQCPTWKMNKIIFVFSAVKHGSLEIPHKRLRKNGDGSKPCTPVVHIKIAGKWMFIPLKMVLIGIDPYPNMLLLAINLCGARGIPSHCFLQNLIRGPRKKPERLP